MDTLQLQHEQNLKTMTTDLLFGLSRFGLNPGDWRLVPKSKNIFVIQNKETPTLAFKGRSRQTMAKMVWDDIILVSL